MDTELGMSAPEGALSNFVFATPAQGVPILAPAQSGGSKFTAEALRQARIALAEYARTNGMYDPVDVLVFTRVCLREAIARLDAADTHDADVILKEVLKIASARCGMCDVQKHNSLEQPASDVNGQAMSESSSAVASLAVQVKKQAPIAAMPIAHGRSMPPQPLGELPDVRPTRVWNSLVHTLSRAVATLLTSMFVRSK